MQILSSTLHNKINVKRILIGHLNANGDILFSSAVARQIKEIDYPYSHLTWAVSSRCAGTLEGNPYIDEILEIPLDLTGDIPKAWEQFLKDVEKKMALKEFDLFIPLQLIGNQLVRYNKTIRLSTLGLYGSRISVPLNPVIRLSEKEQHHVDLFCKKHDLKKYNKIILIECGPMSRQSLMTPSYALKIAEALSNVITGACFILSSNTALNTKNKNIISASELSFRENAEFSKYCDLFIGCSSGITWLLTSDWAKPLPMVQLLNKNAVWFNSVVKDYEVRNAKADHVLEMYEFTETDVVESISTIFNSSFNNARKLFHQQYSKYWSPTESTILFDLFKKGKIILFLKFISTTFKNNKRSLLFIIHLLKGFMKRCIDSLFKLNL